MAKKERSKSKQSKSCQNTKHKKVRSIVKMKPLKERIPDPLIASSAIEYCPKGYTQEEFDRYRQELDRIKNLTNSQLKDILKINKQTVYLHSKAEIQYRCADGYALGRTPNCPSCFEAIPLYDKGKGTYYCKGYKDEQTGQFVPCQSSFERQDLERTEWDNNFVTREQAKKLKDQKSQQKQVNQNNQNNLKYEDQQQILIKTQAKEEA